jgi:hypothetical protein
MVFEEGGPNGREIIALAHQLGAMAREIARSLLGHFNRPIRFLRRRGASSTPLTLASRRRFAIFYYMRDKKCARVFSMMHCIAENMSFNI